MKQVIRLTESQLKNIIKNVISEQGLGSYGMTQQSVFNLNNRPKPAPSTSQPDPNAPESTAPKPINPGTQNNTPAIDIMWVQRALLRFNYGSGFMKVDSQFGPRTKQVVIAFQKAKGLPPTGIVDRATADALEVTPRIKTLPVKQNVFPKPVAKPVAKPSPVAPYKPVDFKFDRSTADDSIHNRQGTNPTASPTQTQANEPDYRKRQGNY